MAIHRLNTLASDAGTNPAQAAQLVKPRPGDEGKRLGQWQTKVGELNNLLTLDQEAPSLDEAALLEASTSSKRPLLQSSTTTLLLAARPYISPPKSAALYEFRSYSLHPGFVQEYMDLLLAVLPVREKYSANVCIWRPAMGNIDQILHLWSYQTMEQRDSFRVALHEEPEWNKFTATITPMIRHMSSQFLVPL